MSLLKPDVMENSSDQENDDFEDACDIPTDFSIDIDLDIAIAEAQLAIQYFFNNQFIEAKQLMEPRAKSSMYHSIGNSVFAFLEALLTFEQQPIADASEALKLCLAVCNRYRKKNTMAQTLTKMVKKTDYDSYSELEVHAELCYAETLLLKAILTFIEDETLSSFIRGGLKIRSCFNSYKELKIILENRDWSNCTTKEHIQSGVCMGIGAFNLMISMLPSRIIKLLEMIGFSGDKQLGITNLEAGYRMTNGIRQILCVMTLLGYHLLVLFVLSHEEGNLEICEEILREQLTKYPNGVWFLFFKGRLEFLKGNLNEATKWYQQSWHLQHHWPQFHHLCFWELLWVNICQMEWTQASQFAEMLVEQSRWSRTIYSYQRAAIMIMNPDKTETDKSTIINLLRDVPKYKQRIAGKSLPMEKFAVKKAERYFEQNNTLILPAIELMFLWNYFKIFRKNFQVANLVFKLIERELVQFEKSNKTKYDVDNRALLLLLKGACLRQMNSPLQALEYLENVVSLQKDIKEDTYLVPYAIMEIGMLAMESGDKEKASFAFDDARKRYTGYSLESRLHFRIHTACTSLKEMSSNKTC